jgi:cytidylate kinase
MAYSLLIFIHYTLYITHYTLHIIHYKLHIIMKQITIAIDGYSSCGKSTMAKDLARRIGYIYVDTGAMYRAVTLFALRHNLFNADGSVKATELQALMPEIAISFQFNATTGRPDTYLNGELVEDKIRGMEVSSHVSPIAALPFVREALVDQQKAMGRNKGIVMDGRDIGTVVLPNATVKIFLTASAEARAQRRAKELAEKGQPADFATVLADIRQRDYQDSHRAVAPLKQADDAILVDTSSIGLQESFDLLKRTILAHI